MDKPDLQGSNTYDCHCNRAACCGLIIRTGIRDLKADKAIYSMLRLCHKTVAPFVN